MSSESFRLMASGDLHWDEHSRFDECRRVNAAIAAEVTRERPDAFLIPGDIYERASTPRERFFVAEWLTAIAETCHVVIAKGNHDRHQDLEILGRLRTKHPIFVEERAGVHLVGGAAIGAVAWPDTASLAAMVGRPLATQALDDIAREALRNVLRGIGAELAAHDGPRILLGHFMVDGSVTSAGQPLIGQELNVGLADLALAQAGIVIAGHIHKPQEWMFGETPIVYAGSPYRQTYGEIEQKSVVLAEFDGARLASWSRIPTPARAMLLVQGAWIPPQNGAGGELTLDDAGQELLAGAGDGSVTDAEIRIRYDVDADQQAAARPAAQLVRETLLKSGAADVKLEPVRREVVRAKAPAVAKATSLAEKIVALWESMGTPPPDRKARLLAKVGIVDGEVDRAVGAPGAIRLKRLRFAGFRPYREAVDIDVDAIPGTLVAVCGTNGAGKSTMLELLPGALHREMPTHGGLADMAIARDAFVEVTIDNGRPWTIRQTVDSETRGGKAYVTGAAGAPPPFGGSLVKSYDAWAKREIQAAPLFLATSFGVQKSCGFLDMTAGDRKAVVLRALGIERYEALSRVASDRAKAARVDRDKTEVALRAERERFGDVGAAEVAHRAAVARVAEANAAADAARAALVRAREEAAAALEAARRHEEAAQARAAIEEQLAAAREEHAALVALQSAGAAVLAKASEIRDAERQLADAAGRERELRAELKRHEDAARDGARDAVDARRRAAAAAGRRVEAEQRAADVLAALERAAKRVHSEICEGAKRAAEDRAILDQAAEIRAAAERLPGLIEMCAAARAEVERLLEQHRAEAREAESCGAAAKKVEQAALEMGSRLPKARREAEALRALVAAAEQALPAAREARTAAEQEVGAAQGEVERLDGMHLAGADERINDLRVALCEIAVGRGDGAPGDVANAALDADTIAAKRAAVLPGQRVQARSALTTARRTADEAHRTLATKEAAAARAPEAEAAETRLREIAAEMARAEAEAAEQQRLVVDARARAAALVDDGRAARVRLDGLVAERGAVAPLAERAAELAGAVARADAWARRREELRADEQQLAVEIAAAPKDGGPEAAAAEEEARAEGDAARDADDRVAQANSAAGALRLALENLAIGQAALQSLAGRAGELDREQALAAGRAPQIARAAADVERFTGELAAIADAPTPPAAPDLAGPAAAARAADEALLDAHRAAAVAQSALAQARTGAEAIRKLAIELSAAEEAISDWDRVAEDLGRNGLQAAEIDCAAPELTELTNDLLRSSSFTRWTTRFQASRTSKDGSKELDGFDAMVFDASDGREADAKLFSPGEKALIGEAMANALSIVACRRAGMGSHGPSLFRDETSSGLAKEHIAPYIAMLRRVAEIVGANKVFFISHVDEMKDLADAKIEIVDGRAFGPGVNGNAGGVVGQHVLTAEAS